MRSSDRRRELRRWAILILGAAALAGCGKPGLPRARILIKGIALEVEIATRYTERVLGLRFRRTISRGTGMVFLFPEPRYQQFVMQDVAIPLSIAFVDEEGTIRQIEDMEPRAPTRTVSLDPVPYVVEVPQGWFEEQGIVEGDRVEGLKELAERYPPEPLPE